MRLLVFFSVWLAILSSVFAQEDPDRAGYDPQALQLGICKHLLKSPVRNRLRLCFHYR